VNAIRRVDAINHFEDRKFVLSIAREYGLGSASMPEPNEAKKAILITAIWRVIEDRTVCLMVYGRIE
jgi:hypothetical protein